MHDYLIVANGDFLPKEIILEIAQDKLMIALDGAYDRLIRLNIQPSILLGDFDSIIELPNKPDLTIIPAPDQLHTDLSKAIHYCDSQSAKSITIICATGGRLDHHEGAMRNLRVYYRPDRPMILHTDQQSILYARDQEIAIKGEIGDKCGIIAYPQGSVSSHGLFYEANHFPLEFGKSENICNHLATPQARVSINGEALVIMPPQYASQRAFMQKSDLEQCNIRLRDAKGKN
jgi:thiamine pyrophosphokinase